MKLIVLLFLCFSSFVAYAEMFKCKDASGKIGYQELPCQASTVSKIKRDVSVGDPNVIAKNRAEIEQFQERRTARLTAEEVAAEKKKKDEIEMRKVRAEEDQARAQEDQAISQRVLARSRLLR